MIAKESLWPCEYGGKDERLLRNSSLYLPCYNLERLVRRCIDELSRSGQEGWPGSDEGRCSESSFPLTAMHLRYAVKALRRRTRIGEAISGRSNFPK